MQWKNLFHQTVLEYGKQYYVKSRVSGYRKQGNLHSFQVTGSSRWYAVKIIIAGGQVAHMSCPCPYAREGHNCKHMAAALYYMEANNAVEMEELLPIAQLTAGTKKEEYSYFNCAAMKKTFSLAESQLKIVSEAVKKGTASLDHVDIGYKSAYHSPFADEDEVEGAAYGSFWHNGIRYPVSMLFDKSQILVADCNVPNCNCYYTNRTRYGNQTLCAHQTALLILLEKYLNQYNPGDSTSRGGSEFLELYQNRKANHVIARTFTAETPLDLTLKPRLQVDGTEWSLSFKIGSGKMFVLKDLTRFVSQVENNESVQFGRSTEWPLGIGNFSEQGKRYYNFIRQTVWEEKERSMAMRMRDRYGCDDEHDIEDSIPLFGRRLDDFFKSVGDETVEMIRGYGKDRKTELAVFREHMPEIQLTLEKQVNEEKEFQGIIVQGTAPELLYSPEAAYYMDGSHINRIPGDVVTELEPLLSMVRDGKIRFQIGRKRLGEFYYNVLPWLESHVKIIEKDKEEISAYLPPEVKFVFYLDAEDKNITCRAEMVYGNWKSSLSNTMTLLEHDDVSRAQIEDFRDVNREMETLFMVENYFPFVDRKKDLFHCSGGEELVYKVLRDGIPELMKIGEIHATDQFRRLNLNKRPNLSVGVAVKSQVLDLTVVSEDISPQELLEILGSYRKKKRFHRLRNGDFFDLENEKETVDMLSQLLESLHIPVRDFVRGKMQMPAYRALYLDKMLEECDGVYVRRDRNFKALVKDFKTVDDADFEVPEPLRNVLRNYQETGYRWLRTLNAYGFGGILADDMGLGKTLQVIALLLSDRESGPALIVTPASLVYNWEEEFKRFAPQLKVSLVTGTLAQRREKLRAWQSQDVLITSYDLLKRDISEYETHEYSYEILDEAQYIKNHTTAAAKAVKVIRSRRKFALTGTPIENRLSELWSIFDYLMPGYLYSYEVFRRDFETPIVKNHDAATSERLKRMVSPFILRRLKEQVLRDLPDKLEEVHYVRMEDTQRKLMDGQVAHMKQILAQTDEEEFRRNKLKILTELVRIRQICCDPSLCFENYDGKSAKREACIELIQSAIEGEHKILLFSQFTSMLELLEGDLSRLGIPYYKITGNTSKEERLRLVNMFNQDAVPVFLISLKAGGTGLNLTGADVVIHYDPWWNIAVQNQATDRAHRIGQTKVVTVYKMIVKDSIEEKILAMQHAKKSLADGILSGENGQIGSMSKEELTDLLSPAE